MSDRDRSIAGSVDFSDSGACVCLGDEFVGVTVGGGGGSIL